MAYDLNIAWSPTTPQTEIEHTLRFAKNLGYDRVALNHIISGPIPTTPNPINNPVPQLTPPHPSFPGGANTNSKPSTTASSLPTVLRRATIIIDDPKTTNYRLADYTRAYDLVSLRPRNEKAFSWSCLDTSEPPAIISLDLTSFLGYHIHHRTAMAAVHKGITFEICYSQVLGPGVDARSRSNFIGNILGLIRATKGRGVIISSEAKSALGLRGPADVVNLLAVWGFNPEKGTEAMGSAARAVVVNEGVRRRGFRGIVDIVQPAEGGEKTDKQEEGEEGAGKKQKQQKKGQQGQNQNQNQQKNQKRKNVDDGTGAGEAGGQEGMSKRQAKKMRKAGGQGS
ncbi:RNase P subunit p30 domain containing protein [Rhypophila decipiens]